MQMTFHDRAPLEKVRRLADGRIAAVAKFARTGIQQYTGAEMGRPDLAVVNVYRPESEVFDEAAMASFAHKAITLGHPTGGVTVDNWKQVAAGWTEGKVARDGEYVEIPLILADAAAIRAYDSGEARELSGGYACEILWGDGVAPDGTPFQATQKKIRGDHIAQVPQGRAGSLARIGDSALTLDAQITAFRDSPQGREFVAYLRSSPGAVPTADAENEAIRRRLGGAAPMMTDADQSAARQRMQDAWHANDPNAWRNK